MVPFTVGTYNVLMVNVLQYKDLGMWDDQKILDS